MFDSEYEIICGACKGKGSRPPSPAVLRVLATCRKLAARKKPVTLTVPTIYQSMPVAWRRRHAVTVLHTQVGVLVQCGALVRGPRVKLTYTYQLAEVSK